MPSIRPRTAITLGILLAAVGTTTGLPAAEPSLSPEELPHFPPVEPAQAPDTFVVRPGFRLEIAAHEPEVMDPIALSFDERGRIYVVEMRDYSERRPERLGRIRRLEDRNADGRFETAGAFLEGLPWPTAVTCWDGGIFVGATPDVIYAKDTDGDGRADIRETIFSGFASDFAPYATNKLNVQAMMNSLQWGLDCRIHGCGSMSGGTVQLADTPFTRAWRAQAGAASAPPAAVNLRGRDFSFDPRTLNFRTETGGGQYGMSFDDTGRKFLCSNSDHLQLALYDERYRARDTGLPLPEPRASIAADGPAAPVFRISPEEPWRVIRTRWRVTGLVAGLIEGGGRSSGYFTSATGLTIYRGDAYGRDFAGDAFVADCGSNLIHRKKLRANGCEMVGTRPDDERDREFIAGRDTWFRPVQFANAPDGCLWAIDMYREIIEHPWSLPPNIKRLLDLNAGSDRGRLYRIAPEGRSLRRQVNLADATTAQLLATLGHANGWHRDTASRLLVERRDQAAVPALGQVLRTATNPLTRLHSLLLLEALDACGDGELAQALGDSDPAVRRHGIRLVESHYAGNSLPLELTERLAARVDDEPMVRLQLAFALGTIRHPQKIPLLARLLSRTDRSRGEGLIADAALSSVGAEAASVYDRLALRESAPPAPNLENESLAALAELVGRQWGPAGSQRPVAQLAAEPPGLASLRITVRLADGIRRAGGSLSEADPGNRLVPLYAYARSQATNSGPDAPGAGQFDAIRLLGHLPADQARLALQPVLVVATSAAAQRAAVEEMLRADNPARAEVMFQAWPGLAPEARTTALELMLRRPSGPGRVLDAVAARRVAPRDLTVAQLNALRGHRDTAIRTRATELFGAPAASRDEAVALALPALNLRGDPAAGLTIHRAQCAQCHRLAGEGYALGPDLESVRSQPKEKLLVAIVDPNREVQPTYLATTVETTDDEGITGIAAAETPSDISLKLAGGLESRIPREKIRAVKAEGFTLMPEGFEATLSLQQIADLLACLTGQP